MTSEEILTVLEELAENVGNCLYDWEVAEVEQLYALAVKLVDTSREVAADLVAQEERNA